METFFMNSNKKPPFKNKKSGLLYYVYYFLKFKIEEDRHQYNDHNYQE